MTLYKMGKVVEIFEAIDDKKWNRDKLNQWYKRGVVIPHTPPRRRGAAAYYSVENMVQILLVDKLCDAGLTQAAASQIVAVATKEFNRVEMEYADPKVLPTVNVYVNLENHAEYKVAAKPPDYTLFIGLRMLPFYEDINSHLP